MRPRSNWNRLTPLVRVQPHCHCTIAKTFTSITCSNLPHVHVSMNGDNKTGKTYVVHFSIVVPDHLDVSVRSKTSSLFNGCDR